MDRDLDELLDKIIEAEKSDALREFRRIPVQLESPVSTGATNTFWEWSLGKCGIACALILIVAATLMHFSEGEPARPLGIDSQTIERALVAAEQKSNSNVKAVHAERNLQANLNQNVQVLAHADWKVSPGLEKRLHQLIATGAVERALSKL